MTARWTLTCLAAAVLLAASPAAGWADTLSETDAKKRARRVLEALPFFAGQGEARYRMVVEARSGERYERTFLVQRRTVRGARRTRLKVVAPAELAGRVYLCVDRAGKADEYWVWVPAFGATRPIEGAQRFGPLLKSHLTYRDVLGLRSDEVSLQSVDVEEIDGEPAVIVGFAPRSEAQTEYARIEVALRRSDGRPLRWTAELEDASDDKNIDVSAWTDEGRAARFEAFAVRPARGGYTRVELLDVRKEVSAEKSDFLPAGLGGAGGEAADPQ